MSVPQSKWKNIHIRILRVCLFILGMFAFALAWENFLAMLVDDPGPYRQRDLYFFLGYLTILLAAFTTRRALRKEQDFSNHK